jgi:large subunit ribosomal protein L9
MKVILTTNIKKLGNVGDQVTVKDGFARNFLIPNNMALRNTKNNLDHFDSIKGDILSKENGKKQKALDLIEAVKKIDLIFTKEADDKDQLYGSISKKEIINFFNEKNIKLLSDDIRINKTIKNLGEHTIEINPYEGLLQELKILVNRT